MMNRLIKYLKEPLVHFLIIGAVLFIVYDAAQGHRPKEPDQIMVSTEAISNLTAKFERTWSRPPTKEEKAKLVEGYIRDEVFYREAVALGLDEKDPIIQKRLRQKIEYILKDMAALNELDNDTLRTYLKEHPEQFTREPEISFRQIYLKSGRDDQKSITRKIRNQLEAGYVPEKLGDPTLLASAYNLTPSEIESVFGESFAREVVALPPGQWSNFIASGLGGHLVLVEARKEGYVPEFEDIRDEVKSALVVQWEREQEEQVYRQLRARYEIQVGDGVDVDLASFSPADETYDRDGDL